MSNLREAPQHHNGTVSNKLNRLFAPVLNFFKTFPKTRRKEMFDLTHNHKLYDGYIGIWTTIGKL